MVQRGSDDAAVGARAEDLGRVHVNLLVAELAMKIDAKVGLLYHCGPWGFRGWAKSDLYRIF